MGDGAAGVKSNMPSEVGSGEIHSGIAGQDYEPTRFKAWNGIEAIMQSNTIVEGFDPV